MFAPFFRSKISQNIGLFLRYKSSFNASFGIEMWKIKGGILKKNDNNIVKIGFLSALHAVIMALKSLMCQSFKSKISS